MTTKRFDEILILWDERVPIDLTPGWCVDELWSGETLPSASKRERGAVLRMTGLKQTWRTDTSMILRRGLARLVLPLRSRKDEATKDPGFEVQLSLPPQFAQFSSKVEPPGDSSTPTLLGPWLRCFGRLIDLTYKVLGRRNSGSQSGEDLSRVKNARGEFEFRNFNEIEEPKDRKADLDTRDVESGPLIWSCTSGIEMSLAM